jgi:hypothetical protein
MNREQQARAANIVPEPMEPGNGDAPVEANAEVPNPVAHVIETANNGDPIEAMRLMVVHMERPVNPQNPNVAGPSNREQIDVDQSAPSSPIQLLCLDCPNHGEVHRM